MNTKSKLNIIYQGAPGYPYRLMSLIRSTILALYTLKLIECQSDSSCIKDCLLHYKRDTDSPDQVVHAFLNSDLWDVGGNLSRRKFIDLEEAGLEDAELKVSELESIINGFYRLENL